MSKYLTSVAFLLGIGVSLSEAQFYQRPATNPYVRPGTTPLYNPYTGGGSYGPFLGNPAVLRPNTTPGTGTAPGGNISGGLAPESTGAQSVDSFGGIGVDEQANNITGHPTAFNSYSRYFNNQGSSFGANLQTGTATNAGANQRTFVTVGNRPPQGRSNTTRP